MFVSNGTIDRVMIWHTVNGGHNAHPRGTALKGLGEMVELCVAAGADAHRIAQTVADEINKAEQRSDFFEGTPDKKEMAEEVADVLINLIVFCRLNGIDPERAVLNKMPVIEARQWQADADGVLRRPDRVNT